MFALEMFVAKHQRFQSKVAYFHFHELIVEVHALLFGIFLPCGLVAGHEFFRKHALTFPGKIAGVHIKRRAVTGNLLPHKSLHKKMTGSLLQHGMVLLHEALALVVQSCAAFAREAVHCPGSRSSWEAPWRSGGYRDSRCARRLRRQEYTGLRYYDWGTAR